MELESNQRAPLHEWLVEPMDGTVRNAIERWRRRSDVRHVAVMPDVHLGEASCIGVAMATSQLIYLEAIGQDIGCGMSALAFDADAGDCLAGGRAEGLLATLSRAIPTIRHTRRTPVPGCELSLGQLSASTLARAIRREGLQELGTLGRGNHFVELQRDDQGRLWLMVHSGSRAVGQLVFDHHATIARGRASGTPALDATSEIGRACENDLRWATAFAAENRARLVEAVARILRREVGLRPDADTFADLPHNYLAKERLGDQELLVHRKGAAPAHAGRPGIIPGSMGTASYHVIGRGVPNALFSSSHGAGRVMSRSQARRAISPCEFGKQMRGIAHDASRADDLCDEAPGAYKDIDAVMRAQRELVTIARRLTPVLSLKGV